MRYGIIGMGAIGGYYGGKMAYSGKEVHFLTHSDYQFVKEKGPSMKLDYDFHRPMEIHYLYTRPIEIAREAGFRMHKLEMLEAELHFLENIRSTISLPV